MCPPCKPVSPSYISKQYRPAYISKQYRPAYISNQYRPAYINTKFEVSKHNILYRWNRVIKCTHVATHQMRDFLSLG